MNNQSEIEFIYIPHSGELREEFGSSMPLRFLGPSDVKCYDSENNEIVIPMCEKCGIHKGEVIGLTCSAWVCMCCGSQ
jgi:hypothetical protein